MSEEKKCLNNGELPEGVTELSMEDLEQVTGGAKGLKVAVASGAVIAISGITAGSVDRK